MEDERHGSPTFYKLLESMANTHNKKSHDYAHNSNPSGNYHFAGYVAGLFNHSPEDAGFAGRVAEKLYRLSVLEGSGKKPKNESIEDTEIDICTIVTLWMADRRDRRSSQIQPEQAMNQAISPVEQASQDAQCKIIEVAEFLTDKHLYDMKEYLQAVLEHRSIREVRSGSLNANAKTSR